MPAGSSQNPVYVTLAPPKGDPSNGLLYHTVVRLSCLNAQGATKESDAIPKIWNEFTDRSVTTVDSTADVNAKPLSYYGDYNTRNTEVRTLLATGVGVCGAFTGLFLDMLKAQGITRSNDYLKIVPNNGASGFLVKAWKFGLGKHSGDPTYPYLNVLDLSDPVDVFSFRRSTGYAFKFADVNRAAGDPFQAKGQGNPDPASIFYNHQIALIDGVYYDASYGVTYSSLDDMDSKSIAGYFQLRSVRVREADLGVDLNGNGAKTDVLYVSALLSRPNDPAVGELKVGDSSTW